MLVRHHIKIHERGVLLRDEKPIAFLEPGTHWAWGNTKVVRFSVTDVLFDVPVELRSVVPAELYREVELSTEERGVLFVDGVPKRLLRPGVHRYWTIAPGVELRRYDARQPLEDASDELMKLLAVDVTFALVGAQEHALLYEGGVFQRQLPAGMHVFWDRAKAPISVVRFSTQAQHVLVPAQDLITRDKVSLRLSLSAEYRVVAPLRAIEAHRDLNDALYRRLQLAAREFVAAKRLDALLEGRDELNVHLKEALEKDAESFGLEIIAAGVKDTILPGEMKALLNRVIEAEKEAAAKVILRREEVAAMKSLASSAKVLEESPGALRLKEMEALREIAAQVGEMVVVLGEGGLGEMRKLIPSKVAKNA